MADIFKTFIKHMDGTAKAEVADAAAKAMAEHCDQRIRKGKEKLSELLEEVRECAEEARVEGRKGEARAWRSTASRIAHIRKHL